MKLFLNLKAMHENGIDVQDVNGGVMLEFQHAGEHPLKVETDYQMLREVYNLSDIEADVLIEEVYRIANEKLMKGILSRYTETSD